MNLDKGTFQIPEDHQRQFQIFLVHLKSLSAMLWMTFLSGTNPPIVKKIPRDVPANPPPILVRWLQPSLPRSPSPILRLVSPRTPIESTFHAVGPLHPPWNLVPDHYVISRAASVGSSPSLAVTQQSPRPFARFFIIDPGLQTPCPPLPQPFPLSTPLLTAVCPLCSFILSSCTLVDSTLSAWHQTVRLTSFIHSLLSSLTPEFPNWFSPDHFDPQEEPTHSHQIPSVPASPSC